MEFHVLELPKLPENLIDGSSDILLWAKFINAERKEEFDMLAQKNPYIESAYQHLQLISQDKQKRLEYEAREKALRDYNQLMAEAEQKGLQQGLKRGIERGIEQGIKQGIEQGIEQKQIEVVKEMLKLGMDKKTICKITKTEVKEIENIQKYLKN